MNVKIIADSASDLHAEDYQKYDIDCVRLGVVIDEKTYSDGKEISPKKVYEMMRDGAAPKTSQATPEDFKETFTKYAKKGQPTLYIAFSRSEEHTSELQSRGQLVCRLLLENTNSYEHGMR